jgi:HTH-type transcriptional regulator/antitoxin HipB
MVIRTPADLAAAIRAGRRALGLDQAGLAARVGVQRQWVVKIESGKSAAEVGLVLRTLNALGLKTEIGESLDEPAAMDPPAGLSFDIDAVLERTRPKEVVNAVGRGPLQTTLARRGSDRTVAGARAPKKRK